MGADGRCGNGHETGSVHDSMDAKALEENAYFNANAQGQLAPIAPQVVKSSMKVANAIE
ncbi:hypothetical protein PAMC26577_14480 [Caballeronia sordidicola]|uniref:Uncharacterized protein n=1 Tax=Caballeronia sordidicola TaxID=196367 RepID=A0A242MVE1_CABSO|nr:hypothetical protein PAMC26577_14480 [Caballeronia sordidicola]